jgi:hypothetical protein
MILAILAFAIPPCPGPVADVSSWDERQGQAFSFRLAPGFGRLVEAPRAKRNIVDYATKDGSSRLHIEYGPSADRLIHEPGVTEYASCMESIGGHEARLMTARDTDGTYIAGATWNDVRPGQRLTLIARTHDLAVLQQMLLSFRTVRIKAPS